MTPASGRSRHPGGRRTALIALFVVLALGSAVATAGESSDPAGDRAVVPRAGAAEALGVAPHPEAFSRPAARGLQPSPRARSVPSGVRAAVRRPTPAPRPGGPAATVPILVYHYIRDNPEPSGSPAWELSVSPVEFDRQMAYLREAGAHTVTLAEVMSALQGGPSLPSRAVVLTFDDGYADFATAAEPVLQAGGLVGTDYVVSGFIGRSSYMTAEQVRQAAEHGMVIGAHTVHHVALDRIPPELAGFEIGESKAALEQLLGRPVEDFAYPYGSFNAAVTAQVVAAGFRDAVTTEPGTEEHLARRFEMHRIRVVAADTVATFARKALLPPPPPSPEGAL